MNQTLLPGCLLVLSAGLCATTVAQVAGDAVTFSVVMIKASNEEPPHVDPALKDVAKSLEAFKFKTYRLIKELKIVVREGQKVKKDLVGDYFIQLELKSAKVGDDGDKRFRAAVEIYQKIKDKKPKRIAGTTIVFTKGKSILMSVPYEQGALILAISGK